MLGSVLKVYTYEEHRLTTKSTGSLHIVLLLFFLKQTLNLGNPLSHIRIGIVVGIEAICLVTWMALVPIGTCGNRTLHIESILRGNVLYIRVLLLDSKLIRLRYAWYYCIKVPQDLVEPSLRSGRHSRPSVMW